MLIRGGGWVDDLLLREDEKNLEAQVRYTRHMNLNTIRLEGIWGSSQKLYDLCDRYGILLMVGWSCQWEWEDYLGKPQESEMYGAAKTPEDMELLAAYFHDQVLWLRNHPSIFVWVVGSDKLPWPEMEKRYRRDLPLLDPSRPLLTSCKTWTSEVSGPSAVKMNGPYDYVTPNYWYVDKENGGAFGFNTETGPGAAAAAAGEPEENDPRRPPVADRRRVGLPLRPQRVQQDGPLHAGLQPALRPGQGRGRFRLPRPGRQLRGHARHVRGLRRQPAR